MIRKAKMEDLDALDLIYERARQFMHSHGNPGQWNDGHPCSKDLAKDVLKEQLYVIEEDGLIQGAFVYFEGKDPTYDYIEGKWLNDEAYGVGHKVVSAALKKGVGDQILTYLCSRKDNIRMDTHADNQYMKRALQRHGFVYTGTIYLANGDPRDAYHYKRKEQE